MQLHRCCDVDEELTNVDKLKDSHQAIIEKLNNEFHDLRKGPMSNFKAINKSLRYEKFGGFITKEYLEGWTKVVVHKLLTLM